MIKRLCLIYVEMIPLLVEKIRINWFPWDSQWKPFEAVQSREGETSQKLHLKRPGNVSFEQSPIKCHMNARCCAFSTSANQSKSVIHAFQPSSDGLGLAEDLFQRFGLLFLLRCKNKNVLVPSPKVKGGHHKCPPVFDGLIDIWHAPDFFLIIWWPNKCGPGPPWQMQAAATPPAETPPGEPFVLVPLITARNQAPNS